MARRGWSYTEERLLTENYVEMTIKELEELLPRRNADMINAKIKRLKATGKIAEGKKEETVKRAYEQRGI
jgi:hypothetical protein